jgi:hypothetical protein
MAAQELNALAWMRDATDELLILMLARALSMET